MAQKAKSLDCYIYSFENPALDEQLVARKIERGMIVFAIPDHGILFKCRAGGDRLDLEFGALFSLLRFVQTSLKKTGLKRLKVHSSRPEFIFGVTDRGQALRAKAQRMKMYQKYERAFELSFAYCPLRKNRAIVPPADLPGFPTNRQPVLMPDFTKKVRGEFRGIQKGTRL